jgi:predicted PurR-regulated permease PerM
MKKIHILTIALLFASLSFAFATIPSVTLIDKDYKKILEGSWLWLAVLPFAASGFLAGISFYKMSADESIQELRKQLETLKNEQQSVIEKRDQGWKDQIRSLYDKNELQINQIEQLSEQLNDTNKRARNAICAAERIKRKIEAKKRISVR